MEPERPIPGSRGSPPSPPTTRGPGADPALPLNRASVAAGVSPAVEGGVPPPGIPGSGPVSRSISNGGLPVNRASVTAGVSPTVKGGVPPPGIGTRFDRRLHASYRQIAAVRHWFVRHVTPSGAFLFWAMLAAGAFNDVSLTMAHQLFGILFCVLIGAVAWLRKPARCFTLQRSVPPNASVGAPFKYRIRLHNQHDRWQRGLDFREGAPDPRPSLEQFVQFAEPGEDRRNWFDRRYRAYRWSWLTQRNIRFRPKPIPLPDIPPGGMVDITGEITPIRRGRLVLDGATVARTDPFGLIRRDAEIAEQPDSIIVYPRRFQLPHFTLPGEGRRLHVGGVAMAGSVGDSEEFISVREYRPGDPLRRIHWAGWARTQRAVVKEYQEEFFVRHALLLDTCGGGSTAEAFEDAVSLAASFAFTVDEHDSLLDLMFVGDRAYSFTAGRGLAHNEQMLQILAGVSLHPSQDFRALESLVIRHAGQLSGCILVLLAWDEPRRQLHQRLLALNLPLLTFIIAERTPADSSPEDVHWITPGRAEETLASLTVPS
jgi:uncharacterized protein (DUF58 family)